MVLEIRFRSCSHMIVIDHVKRFSQLYGSAADSEIALGVRWMGEQDIALTDWLKPFSEELGQEAAANVPGVYFGSGLTW
ncbi:hypothetical protein [Ensifer sp. YR511]|uniref:hypothetical protein n=1 Tax=Ensifer sp. YR511 TaxID=1855294 RepID=UPI001AECB01C